MKKSTGFSSVRNSVSCPKLLSHEERTESTKGKTTISTSPPIHHCIIN